MIVSAIGSGRLADGSPVTLRLVYDLAREPEHTFGRDGVSRLHYRLWDRRLDRTVVYPVVVRTDSIVELDERSRELPVCGSCFDHAGWSSSDPSRRSEPRDVCRSCRGSGVAHVPGSLR